MGVFTEKSKCQNPKFKSIFMAGRHPRMMKIAARNVILAAAPQPSAWTFDSPPATASINTHHTSCLDSVPGTE